MKSKLFSSLGVLLLEVVVLFLVGLCLGIVLASVLRINFMGGL